jgi:hypothetical protein
LGKKKKNFLYLFINKNYLQFVDICGYANGKTKYIFSPSSFGAVVGSGIRDEHPRSATLDRSILVFLKNHV